MKITNKSGLPDPLVKAVTYSDYNRGECDFSITELISPPRISALKRKHGDEIEEDAADRIWALIGSACHEVLRRSANGAIVEKRLFMHIAGVKVSGQLDYGALDKTLLDYKITSIYAMKAEDGKIEWERQLNLYRLLAHNNGFELNALKIIAIGRDWSQREADRDPTYPQHQVRVFDIPVWSIDEADRFLRERIALHLEARKGNHQVCSPEERWEKPPKYAVMKEGRKSAVKLHDSEEYAKLHLQACDKKHYIQFRPGESIRCQSYCPVARFCDHGQKVLESLKIQGEEAS